MPLPAPLRLLALQLVPILVFLLVDLFVQDPLWAIGAALAFVALQTVVTLVRERRFDPFVLLDALLIGGLGGVSLLSENELFFKLKPAIMEGVIVPFFLVLAVGGDKLLAGYLRRYSAGISLGEHALPLVRRMLLAISALVLVHAGLVTWAALCWSRQAWGWISGPGFYVLLVPIALWALVQRLRLRARTRGEAPREAEAMPRTRRRRRRG